MKLKTALSVVVLFSVTHVALAQLNDLQTSFEFTDTDGRFIVGQCPGCAVIEGGRAEAVGEELRLSGENAWVVLPAKTATITFPAPVNDLDFFFKDEDESVASVLRLIDQEGELVDTLNGTPNGVEVGGFTRVRVSDRQIRRLVLQNNAPEGSGSARLAVENLIASFVQEVETTNVDTFFFPRFADGSFGAGGSNNGFTTEGFLVNAGPFAMVRLASFDDSGTPAPVTLEETGDNRRTDATFLFELAEGETAVFKTVGLGDGTANRGLVSGYWMLQVSLTASDATAGEPGGVGGTAVFARSQQAAGTDVLLFETGVQAVRPMQRFSLAMDSRADNDTGLAIVNPPLEDGSAGDGRAGVSLSIWDLNGENLIVTIDFELEAGEAVSKFIWEYVRDFGDLADQELVEGLQQAVGVVTVRSSRPVAPLTLRQNNVGSIFPEAVPTLTSFPVISGAADSINE